jgi:micrococcal nuclease
VGCCLGHYTLSGQELSVSQFPPLSHMSSDYWSSWAAMSSIVDDDRGVLHSVFFVRVNGHYLQAEEHIHLTRYRGTANVHLDEATTKLGYKKDGHLEAAMIGLVINGSTYPPRSYERDVRVVHHPLETEMDETRDEEVRTIWRIVADNGRAIFEDDLDDEEEDEEEEEYAPQRPWIHADDWVFAVLVFDPALQHSQSKDNVYLEVIPLHLGRRQRGHRIDEEHHLHHFQKRYMVQYRTPREANHPSHWTVKLAFHAEKKSAAEWAALASPAERETRDFRKTFTSVLPSSPGEPQMMLAPSPPQAAADLSLQSAANGGFIDRTRGGLFRIKSAIKPVSTERVERVIDGDTIVLTSGERVRLYGMDAPEYSLKDRAKEQTYGVEATDALRAKIQALAPRFRVHVVRRNNGKPDKYGRTLATIYAPGTPMRDLNLEMIQEGFAWYYPIREATSDDLAARYQAAEEAARSNKRGLWQFENPMRPQEFRRHLKEQQQRRKRERMSAGLLRSAASLDDGGSSGSSAAPVSSAASVLAAEFEALTADSPEESSAVFAESPPNSSFQGASSTPAQVVDFSPLPFEGVPSAYSMPQYTAYQQARALVW